MYEHIPVINRMHWPERWLSVIATLLIPLAVRGLERVSTAKFLVPVAVVLAFADAGVKDFWPMSHTTFEPPNCYLQLANQPDGLLLISPFVYSDRAIVYQPIHRKSIVNPIGSGYDEIKWLEPYHKFRLTSLDPVCPDFTTPLRSWKCGRHLMSRRRGRLASSTLPITWTT